MTAIAQDFSLKSAISDAPIDTDEGTNRHGPYCINCVPPSATITDELATASQDKVVPLACQSAQCWLEPISIVDNETMEETGENAQTNVPFVIISDVNGDKEVEVDEVNVESKVTDAAEGVNESVQGTFETREISCHPDLISHTGYNTLNTFLDNEVQINDLNCEMCQRNNSPSQAVTCKDAQEKTYATMQGFFSGLFEGAGLGVGALIAGLTIDKIGFFSAWRFAGFLSLIICIGNLLVNLNLEKCPGSNSNSNCNGNSNTR